MGARLRFSEVTATALTIRRLGNMFGKKSSSLPAALSYSISAQMLLFSPKVSLFSREMIFFSVAVVAAQNEKKILIH